MKIDSRFNFSMVTGEVIELPRVSPF